MEDLRRKNEEMQQKLEHIALKVRYIRRHEMFREDELAHSRTQYQPAQEKLNILELKDKETQFQLDRTKDLEDELTISRTQCQLAQGRQKKLEDELKDSRTQCQLAQGGLKNLEDELEISRTQCQLAQDRQEKLEDELKDSGTQLSATRQLAQGRLQELDDSKTHLDKQINDLEKQDNEMKTLQTKNECLQRNNDDLKQQLEEAKRWQRCEDDAQEQKQGMDTAFNQVNKMSVNRNPTAGSTDFREEEELATTINHIIHVNKEDIDKPDDTLKTLLHHAAGKGRKHIVKLLLDNGAKTMVPDNPPEPKIPVQYAIANKHDEVAALIILATPSKEIRDALNDHGNCQLKIKDLMEPELEKTLEAVLYCLIEDEDCLIEDPPPREVHLNFLEGELATSRTIFQQLAKDERVNILSHPVSKFAIETKWENWGRFRFIMFAALYLVSFVCLTFSVVAATTADDVFVYDTSLQWARFSFEILSIVFVLKSLITESGQLIRKKRKYIQQRFNIVEFLSAAVLTIAIAVRFFHVTAHWYILGIGYLLWAIRVFKYTPISRKAGIYPEVIIQVLRDDIAELIIFFSFLLLGFSGTFMLFTKGDDNDLSTDDSSRYPTVLLIGIQTLFEGGNIVDFDEYRWPSIILMRLFVFITVVIMLNLLIAQLSNRYSGIVEEAHKRLTANKALIIARMEINDDFTCVKGILKALCCCTGVIKKKLVDRKYELRQCRITKQQLSDKPKYESPSEKLQRDIDALKVVSDDAIHKLLLLNTKGIAHRNMILDKVTEVNGSVQINKEVVSTFELKNEQSFAKVQNDLISHHNRIRELQTTIERIRRVVEKPLTGSL